MNKRKLDLIDTQWNVNDKRDGQAFQIHADLIDTQWNVNLFTSYVNFCINSLDLIDTQWNVNSI